MSQATVPEIIRIFISEPHDGDYVPDPERVAAIWARAEKRIPATVIQEALDWINNTPIKDPSGKSDKECHWSLYCVSGFGMPPHPWVPLFCPPPVEKLLGTIFDWVCFTDLSHTIKHPASFGDIRKVYRESIGL